MLASYTTPTDIFDSDVTHPGQGSLLGTPSIAAVVGSVDRTAGKFLGSMRLQPQDTSCEIIQGLDPMAQERIRHWVFNNDGKLPDNILYFRDGVSEREVLRPKICDPTNITTVNILR